MRGYGAPVATRERAVASAEPAGGSLRRRTLEGVVWLTAHRALHAAALLAGAGLLARLLTPAELGLLELAFGVLGLALTIVELGTGPLVIQRPQLDARFLSTVFFVNVATAGVVSVGLLVLGPLMARAAGADDRLVTLLHVVALVLVPLATSVVPRSLLARRLAFRLITVATVAAGAAAAAAAGLGAFVGLESAGFAGAAAYAVVLSIGLAAGARWRPTWSLGRRDVVPLVRYSVSVSAAQTLDSLALQLERFLIAGLLGPAALGVFALARTLTRGPLRHLMGVFDTVLLSGLAELQADPARARRYYLTAVRLELTLFGPLVVFIAVFASDVVAVVYGTGWEPAAVLVQLLAVFAWRNVTGHTVGAVFLSQGRPDVQLRWVTIALGLVTAYVLAGVPWGLAGVALSFTVLDSIGWAISHTMANRLLGLSFRDFLAALCRPAATQAVFATLALGVQLVFGATAGPLSRLVGAVLLLGPVYLVLVRTIDRRSWSELAQLRTAR